ncbi:MAG: hypothetical protein ACYC21_02405 [Eubacteriales bacterium]
MKKGLAKTGISDNKKSKAAEIVSRAAEPLVWLPLMIWLVLWHVNLPGEKRIVYYLVLLVFIFVIPFGYFMYLVFIKREFDLDVTQRNKRIGFTLKSMVSFAVAAVLTYFMNRELFVITSAVFISTLSLILITIRWKISFHGGLNTLIFCTVNYLYNWQFWWLFLLLIPIGWARLTMKKHTPAQFVAGVTLCAAIFWIVTVTGY